MSDTIGLEQYRNEQKEISKLLRSVGGQALLKRLQREWEPDMLMASDPHQTAYNIGKRDAYREILALSIERK